MSGFLQEFATVNNEDLSQEMNDPMYNMTALFSDSIIVGVTVTEFDQNSAGEKMLDFMRQVLT